MTATLSVVSGVPGVELDGFRLAYVAADGTQHGVSLVDVWAVRFEGMFPARRYGARKGRRHLPGLWWSSTMADHVGVDLPARTSALATACEFFAKRTAHRDLQG